MGDRLYMARAIELSRQSIEAGGGPFGAVITQDGQIIGEGNNQVVPSTDPTAHAEIVAIRNACKSLERYDLPRTAIYTSSEPCPMCLAAIWWARISRVYYGNSRSDAASIGFDDQILYDEVAAPLERRSLPIHRLMQDEALEVFKMWAEIPNKMPY